MERYEIDERGRRKETKEYKRSLKGGPPRPCERCKYPMNPAARRDPRRRVCDGCKWEQRQQKFDRWLETMD